MIASEACKGRVFDTDVFFDVFMMHIWKRSTLCEGKAIGDKVLPQRHDDYSLSYPALELIQVYCGFGERVLF